MIKILTLTVIITTTTLGCVTPGAFETAIESCRRACADGVKTVTINKCECSSGNKH